MLDVSLAQKHNDAKQAIAKKHAKKKLSPKAQKTKGNSCVKVSALRQCCSQIKLC